MALRDFKQGAKLPLRERMRGGCFKHASPNLGRLACGDPVEVPLILLVVGEGPTEVLRFQLQGICNVRDVFRADVHGAASELSRVFPKHARLGEMGCGYFQPVKVIGDKRGETIGVLSLLK